MTDRGPFLFLVVLLILVGIGSTAYRYQVYRIPLTPGVELAIWQIEARVEFQGVGGPAQVHLTLPPPQNGFRIQGEASAATGFGFETTLSPRDVQRRAHWTRRDARGQQVLFYKFDVLADPEFELPIAIPAATARPHWEDPYRTAASQIIENIRPITADAASMATQLIRAFNTQPLDQNASLLLTQFNRPELLARLLQTAGVSARLVQGLQLEDGRRRQNLQTFLQVWNSDEWLIFNPTQGQLHSNEIFLWRTASPSVLDVQGGTASRVTFSMISRTHSAVALAAAEQAESPLSLYALPIAEQSMFKLILLLPFGALVVVFMRLVVGLSTSGTFMPVLIALAFLQTELLPGLVSFILVVAVGLMIRSYLSALRLLLVARIATLVVIVIGIMSMVSLLSYQLGLMQGLTITFFPMIILAWTIERMSIIWEEEGPKEVLKQGGGSLLVAVLAYLLMENANISHLAFNFPEIHLIVLAFILVLGRYTGYRLLELRRFAAYKP